MSYYYPEYVRLSTAASAGDNVSICFHERMEVVGAKIVDQGHSDKAIFEAGEPVIVKVVKTASGKATNACICLQLRQARSY